MQYTTFGTCVKIKETQQTRQTRKKQGKKKRECGQLKIATARLAAMCEWLSRAISLFFNVGGIDHESNGE